MWIDNAQRFLCPLSVVACIAIVPLAACSSASGDGDDGPRNHKVVVVPRGTDVVCPDGTHPPCP
ncbi:hypothetical protein [Gluconacetobacter tumulisoli]|uniref:Lipoprotein n=1 Tax=Gluconacetobacter tumulisoli TaxID=1286189 RepID=A0A7W4K617_9PROT|nr:hypothetical protein [Gluconacetobacter tumulisoli]MBB2200943.1 hypothetical protein [Gluconacetobacter tumulisoli]